MQAWKLEGYGKTNNHKITLRKFNISHFTKTRVYFKKDHFEQIEINDYFYPHKWFDDPLSALIMAKQLLENRKSFLEKKLKETKTSLEKCNIRIEKLK